MKTNERSMHGGGDAKTKGGRALFDTAFGPCGIAWSEKGVTRVALQGLGAAGAALGPVVASSEAPPWVRDAMELIALHLGGNPQDLTVIPIDMEGLPPFFQRVYEAARGIRSGETLSYAELAQKAGSPKAFRAVGQALGKNPFCIVVPCHRVLAAGGKLGGFSAP